MGRIVTMEIVFNGERRQLVARSAFMADGSLAILCQRICLIQITVQHIRRVCSDLSLVAYRIHPVIPLSHRENTETVARMGWTEEE